MQGVLTMEVSDTPVFGHLFSIQLFLYVKEDSIPFPQKESKSKEK